MPTADAPRLPAALKIAYTLFVCVLVPVYAVTYGPANFLYFCDIALLITLIGIWREDPLLISMSAVGILAPQAIWLADFAVHFVGLKLTGMADYMFDPSRSFFLRSLSLFHGWLPILLVYLVMRLGYDKRALPAWTLLACSVLLFCYLLMPPPSPNAGTRAVNINYVFGLSDTAPQTWMPPLAWLACLMIGIPALLLAPTHCLLQRYAKSAPQAARC